MALISLEQATDIKSRFEVGVLQLPGVSGVDVGYRMIDGKNTNELAIRVYVQSLAAAPALPKSVEGVAVDVIERSFVLQRP